MKPSEIVKSLSPKGYIDTELLYNCDYPNIDKIAAMVKAGVPVDIIDGLSDYVMIDVIDIENDMSLIKKIKHPSQIIGGYALSEDLAETISSYFGRDILLSIGRPVNKRGYYTQEELQSKAFLDAAIKRISNYSTYTYIKRIVGPNKDYERSLEAAKKAFQLKKNNTQKVIERLNEETLNTPCGAVIFTKDDILSLDAFSILISFYGRDIKQGNQIELEIPIDVNTDYKKHRNGKEPIPYNYTRASGRTLANLFDVSIESDEEPDEWETINTVENTPIYIGKCQGKKVTTVITLSNQEVLHNINSKIDRVNSLYGCNMHHVLLSNIGDFFYPTVYAVHC